MLEKYGITGSAETKQYDHFLNAVEQGKYYRFRVTLNPVVSLSQGIGKRGRTVPLISAEQQLHYLEQRAEGLGFALVPGEYQIIDRSWEELRKHGQKTIQLSKVTYEGLLKVIDKNTFYHTLTHGIGKKKAYGFGLMTVIPM
jgi:CRISPR system Cascade subunit CasE